MEFNFINKCPSPELAKAGRAQWFEVPVSKSPSEVKENPKCVLELKPFASFPHLSFDKVQVGTSKICILYIRNPLDVPQTVQVEKFPFDKGFDIPTKLISVPPLQEQCVEIIWKPEKSLSCRETVFFRTSYGAKTQAYLHGVAVSPKKEKKRKTWHPKKMSHAVLDKMTKRSDLIECIVSKTVLEEKKENVDFSYNCQNLSQQFSLNPCKLPSFNPTPDLSDVRRQTYTINSMFKDSRRDTGGFRIPFSKGDVSSKRKETFVLSDVNPLRELDVRPNLPDPAEKKYVSDIVNDSLEDSLFEATQNSSKRVNYSPIYTTDPIPEVSVLDYCDNSVFSDDIANNIKQLHAQEETTCEGVFDFTVDRMGISRYINENKNADRSNVKSLAAELGEASSNCMSYDITVDRLGISRYINENKNTDRSNVKSLAAELGGAGSNYMTYDSNLNSLSISDKKYLPQENVGSKIEVNLSDVFGNTSNIFNGQESTICEPTYYIQNNYSLGDNLTVKGDPDSNNFSKQSAAVDNNYSFASCNLSNKNVFSQDLNLQPRASSTFFEIPCNMNQKSNSTNAVTKKKARTPPKASALSRKHLKKSPLNRKMQRFKSPNKKKNIKNKAENKNPIHSVSNSRNVSRCFSLKKDKLLEKLCQKNPFATVNAYYDEYWMEKQELAFTNWLNFILTPNDDFISSEEVKVNSAQVWVESMKDSAPNPAPSKEELSYKTYTAAYQLNQLRKSSFLLYQSEELAVVIKKIEKEVDMKKIMIRKDRAVHADLGIKKDLLKMLLSYNPLWLRIGLETIYGEIICLKNNRDILGLSRFIIFRFLSNPELVAKFTHPSTPNYYKPGYEDEIKRFMLKKFLLLVYFLDVCKNTRLISYNPCLFNKSSEFKSSRDMLLNFSKEYLSGEGDLTKHLRLLGCTVTYQQMPIEEFDYAVRNIATDLRCGLRLGKVLELLLNEWSLSKALRVNTINRVNKIYNNDVILKALRKVSIEIEGNIDARDIVDGNREKTLSLLWQIVFKTQISKLLNKEMLVKENTYLKRLLQLKADYAAFSALEEFKSKSEDFEISFTSSKLYEENEILKHLLQWCQYVCAQYKLKVQNFTASFSDGRALCLLLHHYHPNMLPYDTIKQDTSSTYVEKVMECDENDSGPFMSENDKLSLEEKKELVQNEKANWDLAFSKLQEIGQIPILSFPTNVSNRLPDEKVMIIMVSYINIRLMELSSEIRAARTIQLAYRRWKLEKKLRKLKVEIAAARVIQKAWRALLAYKRRQVENMAAIIIQCSWRMYSAKKKLQYLKYSKSKEFLNAKAVIIQAIFRGYAARKQVAKSNKAAIIIQKNVRMMLAQNRLSRLKKATIKIQNAFRAKKAGSLLRQKYLHLKNMVIRLQACSRGMILRRTLRKKETAAIVIQSYFRMHLNRKRFLQLKKSSIVIQKNVRRMLIQDQFSRLKEATLKIQSAFRAKVVGSMQRQKYLHLRNMVIRLQACSRGMILRRSLLKREAAAIVIQSYFRMHLVRKRFLIIKKSSIIIQRKFRSLVLSRQCHQEYRHIRKATIHIQKWYRHIQKKRLERKSAIKIQALVKKHIQRKKYLLLKSAALKIQHWWRAQFQGRKTRCSYLLCRKRIILLQALTRRLIAQRMYQKQVQCLVKIQKNVRKVIARRNFNAMRSSAVKIQTWWRAKLLGKNTRSTYLMTRKRIILLQSLVRQFIAQKSYKSRKLSAVIIQKNVRMFLARKEFCKRKASASKIQIWWKAVQIGKEVRVSYLSFRKNIILVQAFVRGWIARKTYRRKKCSAIVIQKCVRRQIAQRKFCILKDNAIKIQRWWKNLRISRSIRQIYIRYQRSSVKIQSVYRMYRARNYYQKLKKAVEFVELCQRGKQQRRSFIHTKKGIIKIQASYRAYRCKKQFIALKSSAIMIQSAFRRYKHQKNYLKLKQSTIIIQGYYRQYQKMRSDHEKYLKMKTGFTKLQAVYRGVAVRKQIKTFHLKAVIIQSWVKMVILRRSYLKLKMAAIVIQQRYLAKRKMNVDLQKYQNLKSATILIQSHFRKQQAYKQYKTIKTASVKLQSFARMLILRKKFYIARRLIIRVQQIYRAKRLMTAQRLDYITKKKATIILQSRLRGYMAKKNFQKIKNACIVIQSSFRSWKQRSSYLRMKAAAISVQSRFRALKTGRAARSNFVHFRKACIKIQSYVRMAQQRRNYNKICASAVVIQNRYRSLCVARNERQRFLRIKDSCIVIQSFIRMCLARRHFIKLRKAAIVIQSLFRMLKAHKNYTSIKKSVTILQIRFAAWKLGRSERAKYVTSKKSATLIQSAFRCYTARKTFKAKLDACVKIQSYYRAYIYYNKYKRVREATLILQKYARAFLKGREAHSDFLRKRKRIIKAQALVRGWLVRKHFSSLRVSATKIQTCYRAFVCRKKYLTKRKSVIVLQKYFKAYLIGSKVRHQYIIMKQAAIVIQSIWRGKAIRQELGKQKMAAIKIQSLVRGILKRKKFLKVKKGVQVIECRYSALKMAREEYSSFQLKKKSCIKIQSWWRRCLTKMQRKKEVSAAIIIQKTFRKYKLQQAKLNLKCSNGLTPYQQRQWYINLRTSLIEFQRSARRYIAKREKAAIVIQSFFRRCLVQKKEKREKAALKIQALWRGYSVRRHITDKLLLKIRKNIGTKSDEYHWLISRTNRAVNTLLYNDNIQRILMALKTLDTCTKLSSLCCVRLEQSGGLSRLINVINMCNRSVPHREILVLCLNILLNVAKYDKTVNSVWKQKNLAETAVTLMRAWIKDSDIFSKCCCLLYIFCQESCRAEVLKSSPAFATEIEKIYRDVMRRHTSQSQNTKIPRKSTLNFDTRESLHIDPEWLLGKHRKRAFKDPDVAISSLMQSLGLKADGFKK